MARLINVSIDLTKIDKSKIVVGAKGGKWLPLTISVNDEKDQFDNDTSITIGQSKEERESKAPRIYLGNGRTIWTSEPTTNNAPSATQPQTTQYVEEEHDDLPF